MQTLKQLCKPRSSVFDSSRRDIVLDLKDLIENKIAPAEFFDENFLTDSMSTLLEQAFRRFAGESDQAVYLLSQAMGGGKTHNMVALGLLAKYPEYRAKVMSDDAYPNLGTVRVVAFSGRDTATQFGVWGRVAEQLGKKEAFRDFYSPLQAPGQPEWEQILAGEPLLILLDELPPYLENARSRSVGDSNLERVTTTALTNLLVAANRLPNVCVVISDLKATYEGGSQQISVALQDLQSEVGRSALTLEPVRLNTDEIYHILRKRLFEELPDQAEVDQVAQAFAQAVRDARQMDITSASPEQFARQLKESYPFHFSVKDLYARFKENPGFQQTRGLIRFMRTVVARLFEPGGEAEKLYLIQPHNLNLNDRETLSEVNGINPTLANAISHDIAANGQSIAEQLDAQRNTGTSDAQDLCKLLLVASLANVLGGIRGLNLSEIVGFLCAPGRDISRLTQDVLPQLNTRAWYLHATNDTVPKLYFKDTQNIVAQVRSMAENYILNRELLRRKLRDVLGATFNPAVKDCYQEVQILLKPDELDIKADKVTLIVLEPYSGGGLAPDVQKFYDNLDFKNRVLFLTGTRETMDRVNERTAELRAISDILTQMQRENVPAKDPQFQMASTMADTYELQLNSAFRETFTTLVYPQGDRLMSADIDMQFSGNSFKGEEQIRQTLKQKQKFEDAPTGDIFRKKCEQRLFTTQAMPWTEVKRRAAMNTAWQWHRVAALDDLKTELVAKRPVAGTG